MDKVPDMTFAAARGFYLSRLDAALAAYRELFVEEVFSNPTYRPLTEVRSNLEEAVDDILAFNGVLLECRGFSPPQDEGQD